MNTININRKKLTSSEIEEMKDYQKLMNRYSNSSSNAFLNNKRNIIRISLVSVISISIILLIFLHQTRQKELSAGQELKVGFIKPPIPGCEIRYNTIVFSYNCDTSINLSSVSTIFLKENSLLDSAGNSVRGPVEIRYREFMNPAEIFLSGIPMAYDSADIRYTFQSAGMIEINAFFKDKPLFIDPEKPIRVTFRSNANPGCFNVYELDTTNRNWIFQGRDAITYQEIKMPETQEILEQLEKSYWPDDSIEIVQSLIKNLQLDKPEPPILANSKKWHLTIDILPDEFPELLVYANTVFEVDEQYNPLNIKHASIEWDDVLIEKSEKPRFYYLTFKNKKTTCKYLACPVLSGKNYDEAFKNYETAFSTYQNELNQRLALEKRLREQQINSRMARSSDSTSPSQNNNLDQTIGNVFRSFSIMQFGIWNCDMPLQYNKLQTFRAIYRIDHTIYKKTIYLADENKNALIIFSPAQLLKFDRSSKNMLWMIMDNNQIAVFTDEDFKMLPRQNLEYTFDMHLIKTPISSPEVFIELYKSGFKELRK